MGTIPGSTMGALAALLLCGPCCGERFSQLCYVEEDADGDGYMADNREDVRVVSVDERCPDGYAPWFGSDCDDEDPDVHPGAGEICDGIDNGCSGGVDDVPACADDDDSGTDDEDSGQ